MVVFFDYKTVQKDERAMKILQMIADGLTTAEICKNLSYSERTIKNTIYFMMNVTATANRPALVAWGFRQGLLK